MKTETQVDIRLKFYFNFMNNIIDAVKHLFTMN